MYRFICENSGYHAIGKVSIFLEQGKTYSLKTLNKMLREEGYEKPVTSEELPYCLVKVPNRHLVPSENI